MVSGAARQPEVVDSVADHVTRMSPDDARPYFLYEAPDVTSSGSSCCCDVTRRSGNPSGNPSSDRPVTTSRELLTLEVPTLTSRRGGTADLRMLGGRVDRCCSHLPVLPLLPPPPARTCVTCPDRCSPLVDVDTATTYIGNSPDESVR